MKSQALSFSRSIAVVVLLLASAAVSLSQTIPVRKIAFSYGGGAGSSRIVVIHEDGSGQTPLTDEGFNDRSPSWSPDGLQIVFESDRYGRRQNILRMNADGTGIVPLTDFGLPTSSSEPSWSPDGTRILFVSDLGGEGRTEIWVMNADGTSRVRLTTNIKLGSDFQGAFYSRDLDPAWSPDGSRIVFSSNRDGLANPEIYLMNADGSNLTRLTNNFVEDTNPAWSPDGQRIAFFSRGDGRSGIYVIHPNGTNERQITTSGVEPDWSPDGSKIVFTDFDPAAHSALALYLVRADGSNRIKLTNNGTVDSRQAAWQTLGGPAPPPPPGPPTYSVSGRVADITNDPSGPGVTGVTLTLTGSASATRTTDRNGNFFFGNLPENGSFTLTPSSPDWGLFPESRSFSTSSPFTGFVGRNLDLLFGASPIFLQFRSTREGVTEGSGARIIVERHGSTLGKSTIDYATSDGTAKAGIDYVAVSGTLVFNPFESQKSFTIPIIYDKIPDPGETVNLTLTNPTGSTARGRDSAVLTINEPPPEFVREVNSSRATALNAHTWLRDPFALTTRSFLGQNLQTRLALFARFVDLLPDEDFSAVTVEGFTTQGEIFQLPVEFVGPVPNPEGATEMGGVTQINVRLPTNLPSGELFLWVKLRGLTSNPNGIRIQ